VPVATQRVVERRLRAAGGKTDGRDAILVAQALLAEPDLPPLTQPDWVRALQELTRTRKALADTLKGQRMRLQDTREPTVRHALENVIDSLEAQVQALGQEIEQRVKELAPRLLQLVGVGSIIAATLLSEVADITRFASPDRFAAYCGAAPQPWQSGASQRVRVNPRGNRRLNWALHLITRTRLSCRPHQSGPSGPQEAGGQDPQRSLARSEDGHCTPALPGAEDVGSSLRKARYYSPLTYKAPDASPPSASSGFRLRMANCSGKKSR
jgi:transposase